MAPILSGVPGNASERRACHITATVEAEAEAIPANILRAMLRERIESFLPPDAIKVTRVVEDSERQLINGFVSMLPGDVA
jgi:hypothetical protein